MAAHDVLAEALDMGFEAAMDGHNESYCPFHPSSERWDLWMQGFEQAMEDIRKKYICTAAPTV